MENNLRCCGVRTNPNTTEFCGKRNDCKRFVSNLLPTGITIDPKFKNYFSRNGQVLWTIECEDFIEKAL